MNRVFEHIPRERYSYRLSFSAVGKTNQDKRSKDFFNLIVNQTLQSIQSISPKRERNIESASKPNTPILMVSLHHAYTFNGGVYSYLSTTGNDHP